MYKRLKIVVSVYGILCYTFFKFCFATSLLIIAQMFPSWFLQYSCKDKIGWYDDRFIFVYNVCSGLSQLWCRLFLFWFKYANICCRSSNAFYNPSASENITKLRYHSIGAFSWECYGVLLVKFPLILQKSFVKDRPNTHVYQRLQRSRPITKYLLWFGCLS